MGGEELAAKQAAETQVAPPKPILVSNPFKEAARQSVDDAMKGIIAANANQKRIGKIPLSEKVSIPIIKRPFIGSTIGAVDPERGEVKALMRGEDFIALRFGGGIMMLGLPAEFGLTPEMQQKIWKKGYAPGDLPKLETLLAQYAETFKDQPVSAIYIGRPLDCLQFVNHSIKAGGARKVNPGTGKDLSAALNQPGSAIIETRSALLSDVRKGVVNQDNLQSFTQNAKTGDVIIFLKKAPELKTLGEAREWEELSNDRVIWLDDQNRQIDISKLSSRTRPKATAYTVAHTAVFSGRDEDRPLISQAHINWGSIATEAFDTYLSTSGRIFDATAIISFDFFVEKPENIVVAKK